MTKPKKAKQQPKPVDPLAIFDHAYRILSAEVEMRQNPKDQLAAAKATTILSAFGLELLLKCLIMLDQQIPPPTHNLAVLFRRLNHKHKRLIEEKWDNDPAARAKITPFATNFKLPTDLPNAIATCNTAFERMRYIYEYPDGAHYYLQALPILIVNVILETIKPEWKSPHPILSTFPVR